MKRLPFAILAALIVLGGSFAYANAASIFQVIQGGTGWSNIQTGAIPYGQGTSRFATTTQGTGGFVLGWANGIPTWVATSSIQNITLTTTGSSGAATFIANVLNIPQYSGGGGGSGTVGTSTVPTVGQLSYWTSNGFPSLLGSVATTTLTGTAPITFSQPISVIGSVASVITCATSTGSIPGCLSAADWTTFNSKQAAGNYITDLTGDVTAAGPGSVAVTLATVNGNVGSFGSATQTGTFTVNGKGLITAASNTTITPAVGSITGFGTGVSTALGVNVGTAGAFVVNGGALGTPSSGTLTSATGLPLTTGITGVLPVANGGTNNSSVLTAGSVLFSSGTAVTQDNANFFWDDTTNNLGIGQTAPYTRLEATATTSNGTTTSTGYGVSSSQIRLASFAEPITVNEIIGGVDFVSNDTSLTGGRLVSASIQVTAAGTHTGVSVPSDLVFFTSPASSVPTEKMRITSTGIGIGTSTPFGRFAITSNGTGADTRGFTVANSNNVAVFSVGDTGETAIGTTTDLSSNFALGVQLSDSATGAGDNTARLIHGDSGQTGTGVIIGSVRAANSAFKFLQLISDYDGTPVEQVAFYGNGQVSIGSSTPWGQLAITSSTSTIPPIALENSAAAGDGLVYTKGHATDTGTGLTLNSFRTSSSAYNFIKAVQDVDGTPVTSFLVRGDGKVGISSSTPGTILSLGDTTNAINLDNTATSTFSFGIKSTSIQLTSLIESAKGIFTSFLRIPYGTAPSITVNGDIGVDSTSGQFRFFSTTEKNLGNGNFYPSFTYATSTAWTGTTTIPLGPAYIGETWNGVQCFSDVGTLNVSFYDGTNRMNLVAVSTTVGTVTLSTNNTFTASEKRYVDIGTPATAPTKISCTVSKSYTND